MPNLNRITVIGHVGADPELRDEGTAMCKFTLATTEHWTDKENEKKEKTTWHNIVAWGKQAETLAKYVHKGDPIYVEGRQEHDSYEDKEGNKKYWSQIVVSGFQFLRSKKDAVSSDNGDGGGDPF